MKIRTFFLSALLLLTPALALASPVTYTWTYRATLGTSKFETNSLAISADGTKAFGSGGPSLFLSSDSGVTWTNSGAASNIWWELTSSADGTKVAAATNGNYPTGDYIYLSTNGGATWTASINAGIRFWDGIASSADGTKLAATVGTRGGAVGDIYTSTDGGATWTDRTSAGTRSWEGIASSADGTKLVAVVYNGDIFTSVDSGATWTDRTSAGTLSRDGIASSADGTKLAVTVGNPGGAVGDIYTSTDGGATWTDRTSAGTRNWVSIASSADGTKLAADVYNGDIFTSADGGTTWNDETGAPTGALWIGIVSSSDGTTLLAIDRFGKIYTGTEPSLPQCSITLDQNPIPYGSGTTLRWTSRNANTSFYINNVGYVTPNTSSSAQVQPSSATDYTGTAVGTGGTTTCAASSGTPAGTLNVTAPPATTATITASSTSIYVGQSTNLLATFKQGSGDSITADNIDEPLGTGQGANTNPGPKSITFTPASAGTYTFYARATTGYYPSWTTYNQVNVTVTANPSCTISISPTSIAQGQSATVSWTSSNAASFSINNLGSKTPNTPGSQLVSPSQSTDYTGTASSGGVNYICKAPSGTPQGTLNITCTQSYSCSGQTIVRTNTDCSTTNVTTCFSPQFCSAGSSSCLAPNITFNTSNGYTGHLQVVPTLASRGHTVQVHWNVSNAQSCTVTGTDGDSWSGLSSSNNGQTSKVLNGQTTFSLSCIAYSSNPNINEQVTVNLAPIFQEF